jgi:hypothetical protein
MRSCIPTTAAAERAHSAGALEKGHENHSLSDLTPPPPGNLPRLPLDGDKWLTYMVNYLDATRLVGRAGGDALPHKTI